MDSNNRNHNLHNNRGTMTIVKKENIREKGITIDTTGPAGNAFNLLGVASRLGKQMEWCD